MFIVNLGINYKTAPVEIREKISFSDQALPAALKQLRSKPTVEGCVILSTCNRSEIYIAATDTEKALAGAKEFLSDTSGIPAQELEEYLYVHTIYDAIRHLFRLVSGLDSMVIGETQILGQVKEAYQKSFANGAANPVLNMFFQQALTVGKRVRTETKIDSHAVSISYAAVELARQRLKDLQGSQLLVIGAGEMSELTVRHMMANGTSVIRVVNRSQLRGMELAAQFNGEYFPAEELFECLKTADIVVSATAAPDFIVTAGMVREAMAGRRHRPLFIVDIAVPRDVDPAAGAVPGVTLLDIDDLRHVVDQNLGERRLAAEKAASIIETEIDEMLKSLGCRFMVPTITAFKKKMESIRDEEVERALHRLDHLSPREQKVIRIMASQIINQIMHDPVTNLKESAATQQGHLYAEIFQNLFNLRIAGQKGIKGPADINTSEETLYK